MKKYYIKMLFFVFAVLFGVFMFIYGERDDSPGGQLMGLAMFVIGVGGLIKSRKNF